MSFVNLHQHSEFSILDGCGSIEKIVKRNKELGYKSISITDHANLFASVKLEKECKKTELKAIHGIELYLSPDAKIKDKTNRKLSHLCILAKNLEGWKQLIKINNRANRDDFFYYRPRIDLETLSQYAGNIIGFSGHPGSDMANVLFTSLNAYRGKTYTEVKSVLKSNWEDEATKLIGKYQDILGKENFFLEISLTDSQNFVPALVIAECLRNLAKKLGVQRIASIDSHYPEKSDAVDQRVLLCSALQTTLKEVNTKLDEGEEFGLDTFFKSNQFYIPSFDEIKDIYEKEELENTVKIGDICESYSILNKPLLPKCSDNSVAELREICRNGWREKIEPYVDKNEWGTYKDRINHELKVVEDSGLSDYFLIVRDFMNYAHSNNIMTGPGRGSAGGCLVSYLSDITLIDPIRFNLLFERFYNAGRNTKDKVQFPDIDVDFPASSREKVIEYIRKKYGRGYVGQICTLNRMMGRGALRDILRVHSFSFDEINKITENIPDEAKIADDLQEMKEDGESSILLWSLINNPDKFKEWCILEEGKLKGPLSNLFAQAMRLEGTSRATGKHASGIVISPTLLEDYCPMMHDKSSDELIVGLELEDMENMGLVKFDILGLSCLDRMETCVNLIEGQNV